MPKWSPGQSSTPCWARSFSTTSRAGIADPADRARVGRMPGERVAEALEPGFHHRIIRVQDAARAFDELFAHERIERDGGEVVGRPRGTDRRVVVPRPRFLAERGL